MIPAPRRRATRLRRAGVRPRQGGSARLTGTRRWRSTRPGTAGYGCIASVRRVPGRLTCASRPFGVVRHSTSSYPRTRDTVRQAIALRVQCLFAAFATSRCLRRYRTDATCAGTKVFCFFFSKKKALLPLPNRNRKPPGIIAPRLLRAPRVESTRQFAETGLASCHP